MTDYNLKEELRFDSELQEAQYQYKVILEQWLQRQDNYKTFLRNIKSQKDMAQKEIGLGLDALKSMQVKMLEYFPDEKLNFRRNSDIQKFIRKHEYNYPQDSEVGFLFLELRELFRLYSYSIRQLRDIDEQVVQEKKDIEQLKDRAKSIDDTIISMIKLRKGKTDLDEDTARKVLDYKVKRTARGLLEIERKHIPYDEDFARKLPQDNKSIKVLDNLIENIKKEPVDDKLHMLVEKVHSNEKENRAESKLQKNEDDAYQKFLEEKENIPPTKYELPKYKINIASPSVRNAVGRLQNENLVGRKLEFEWISKKNNKRHAQEMLAVRYGIAHSHRTIVGKIKKQGTGNRVDIYLSDYKIVVECSIQQDELGKWGISTFFRERKDWSICENSTPDVPSGLSQELDMSYTLKELIEFHNLIKNNYDNQIGRTKKRANG